MRSVVLGALAALAVGAAAAEPVIVELRTGVVERLAVEPDRAIRIVTRPADDSRTIEWVLPPGRSAGVRPGDEVVAFYAEQAGKGPVLVRVERRLPGGRSVTAFERDAPPQADVTAMRDCWVSAPGTGIESGTLEVCFTGPAEALLLYRGFGRAEACVVTGYAFAGAGRVEVHLPRTACAQRAPWPDGTLRCTAAAACELLRSGRVTTPLALVRR